MNVFQKNVTIEKQEYVKMFITSRSSNDEKILLISHWEPYFYVCILD